MPVEVMTRKWGNSLGVIIPAEEVQRLHLRADELVILDIHQKENALKELFGSMRFDKPTRQLIDEFRKDVESKWLV